MDGHGVGQAVVVCASIGANPDNASYALAAARRHRGRLRVFADFDCPWSGTYHVPGAGGRLQRLAEGGEIAGIAHYLSLENDGWLRSEEADGVFAEAGRRSLVVSLSARPVWQADLRRLAARHPDVPVLCHHLGLAPSAAGAAPGLDEVLASAEVPNIFVKASGAYYAQGAPSGLPAPVDAYALLLRVLEAYGPERVLWGSDYPASLRFGHGYQESLDLVGPRCTFLSPDDRSKILGANLARLLPKP
jgi:predicted TIM-barrel fold metal-dependent hydrolase